MYDLRIVFDLVSRVFNLPITLYGFTFTILNIIITMFFIVLIGIVIGRLIK